MYTCKHHYKIKTFSVPSLLIIQLVIKNHVLRNRLPGSNGVCLDCTSIIRPQNLKLGNCSSCDRCSIDSPAESCFSSVLWLLPIAPADTKHLVKKRSVLFLFSSQQIRNSDLTWYRQRRWTCSMDPQWANNINSLALPHTNLVPNAYWCVYSLLKMVLPSSLLKYIDLAGSWALLALLF